MGFLFKEKGDLDGAVGYFQTATRLNPNYYQAHRDLGLTHYERYHQGITASINDGLEELAVSKSCRQKTLLFTITSVSLFVILAS